MTTIFLRLSSLADLAFKTAKHCSRPHLHQPIEQAIAGTASSEHRLLERPGESGSISIIVTLSLAVPDAGPWRLTLRNDLCLPWWRRIDLSLRAGYLRQYSVYYGSRLFRHKRNGVHSRHTVSRKSIPQQMAISVCKDRWLLAYFCHLLWRCRIPHN